MTDRIYYWHLLGWRLHLTIRPVRGEWIKPLPWFGPHSWSLHFSRGGNGYCYCPEGFWLIIGTPLWRFWFTGSSFVTPCPCDYATATCDSCGAWAPDQLELFHYDGETGLWECGKCEPVGEETAA